MLVRVLIFTVMTIVLAGTSAANCISVVPAGTGLFFWSEVVRGAKDAARDLNLSTYIRAPSAETNVAGQRLIVESAIDRGCKALLLAPNSPDIVMDVSRLAKRGVPTVYIDRDLGGQRLSVVKTNDYEAGVQAGHKMIELLEGNGRVGVFRMDIRVATTSERETGFLDTVRAAGLKVTFEEYLGSSIGEARANSLLFMKDVDDVDGIFTPNEATTVGVIVSISELKKSSSVKHIGFDYNPLIERAIAEGKVAGVMVQQPYKIGYVGAITLAKSMSGERFGDRILIDPFYVDKSNLGAKRTRRLLGGQARPAWRESE